MNLTEEEKILWQYLRANQLEGIKFRRQHAIGSFIVDFCAPSLKIVIEVDGSQHIDQKDYDLTRTRFLEDQGYQVLRFWDSEVKNQIPDVLEKIRGSIEKKRGRGLH